jgi:hypothetical protein
MIGTEEGRDIDGFWLDRGGDHDGVVLAGASLTVVRAGVRAGTSVHSGLSEVYPITVIEAIWAVVALQRFVQRSRREALTQVT